MPDKHVHTLLVLGRVTSKECHPRLCISIIATLWHVIIASIISYCCRRSLGVRVSWDCRSTRVHAGVYLAPMHQALRTCGSFVLYKPTAGNQLSQWKALINRNIRQPAWSYNHHAHFLLYRAIFLSHSGKLQILTYAQTVSASRCAITRLNVLDINKASVYKTCTTFVSKCKTIYKYWCTISRTSSEINLIFLDVEINTRIFFSRQN